VIARSYQPPARVSDQLFESDSPGPSMSVVRRDVYLLKTLILARCEARFEIFYVRKGVDNLAHLRDLGHQVNRKLLEVERVSDQCVLTQEALDRLQCPTVETGQRASALRFGDPRVMALLQALTGFTHLPRGFRNRDLRPQVEALLGRSYSTAQMTYDLLAQGVARRPRPTRYRNPETSPGGCACCVKNLLQS
jgi:hypothetical protein